MLLLCYKILYWYFPHEDISKHQATDMLYTVAEIAMNDSCPQLPERYS